VNGKPDYEEMWKELQHKLNKRVERMVYNSEVSRKNAYEDVLLLMDDLEDNS
jgi:hypothetical protein